MCENAWYHDTGSRNLMTCSCELHLLQCGMYMSRVIYTHGITHVEGPCNSHTWLHACVFIVATAIFHVPVPVLSGNNNSTNVLDYTQVLIQG